MKKFLVLTAIFAAMFLVISCGSSDSDDDNKGNNGNNSNNEEGNSEGEDSSNCTKITPKWSEPAFDNEHKEFYMNGSYTPRTGINPEYSDIISFILKKLPAEANKEYDFASTTDIELCVVEDYRVLEDYPSTEEESAETEYEDQWTRTYLAVSGTLKINSLDMKHEHISLSFKNVKLILAQYDREDNVWTLTGDESKCLFVDSSFEK